MSHILTYFKHVPLPRAMPKDDLSTGKVDSSLRNSIGGVYNYFGDDRRLPRRQTFRHRGLYEGQVVYRVTSDGDYRVTDEDDYRVTAAQKIADLQGKTDDLKAQIGEWGQLWRERLSDGQLTYKRCRLIDVRHVEDVEYAGAVSEVESEYETEDVAWRSESSVTATVTANNGVPAGFITNNSGALRVVDTTLTILCTSGTITEITLLGQDIDLTWTGSIASGQELVIDSGDQVVPLESTDQYDGLELNAGHTVDEWLPLALGVNAFVILVTGGNAIVTMEHSDLWP